jgi:hypothetical protein
MLYLQVMLNASIVINSITLISVLNLVTRQKVDLNRTKFRTAKSEENGSASPSNNKSQPKAPFKWRPPDRNEKKRVISTKNHDERVYIWDASTKR